jgi:hypothetical protein
MPHRCRCPQGACNRNRASPAQWSPRSATDEQAMNRPCQRHQNDRRALLAQLPTRLAPNARAHSDSKSDSAPRSAIMRFTRAHKRKHARDIARVAPTPNAQLKQLRHRGQERGERPRELVATQVTMLRRCT